MSAVVAGSLGVVAGLLLGLIIGVPLARRSRRPDGPTVDLGPAEIAPTALPALVVQVLTGGVVVVDRGDLVVLANPSARQLGAVVDDRLATDSLRALVRGVVDTGTATSEVLSLVPGRKGREPGSVTVTAVPLRSPDGTRVAAVALMLDDVTEARRLEAVRRDFVANVSHELKTPVGALTLLAEAVQDASDDPEAVQRFAGRMQHEGQRLGRLVGELIALSRVQGVDALPDPDPVAVRAIIDEAVDFTHLAADNAGITVTTRVEDGLQVSGNGTQLSTALANLVDNAVSYSPDGTRVAVTARAMQDGADGDAWVEIAVTDQGIGIAEGDLDRVFERFFRVDPARSRATGGTGLGLAIVKHIVTNHGGRVEVWSVEGAGSTFTIRLPLLAAVEEPAPPALSDEASTRRDRSGSAGRATLSAPHPGRNRGAVSSPPSRGTR